MIDLFRPSFGSEEVEAVEAVLYSGWAGLGPKVLEFEKQFAQFIGADDAVAVNSGTSALYLAVRALGIGVGDEVIVPTFSFVSTAHAVAQCGATPVFADVDTESFNITAQEIARLITHKTRAIIVVHYGGMPVDIEEIISVANGIPVIEDAAHACGASVQGRRIGTFGVIGCFSFNATKNLAAGDGGALTTNNPEIAAKARELRWLGLKHDTWKKTRSGALPLDPEVYDIALKFQMNDITAAIALIQLSKLEKFNARRREIYARYNDALSGIEGVTLRRCESPAKVTSSHLYTILVENRDVLRSYLLQHGVYTGVHYRPMHTLACYAPQISLPNSEFLYQKILSLPVHPTLKDEDADCVVRLIREFGDHQKS